jgi:hypothetical protein
MRVGDFTRIGLLGRSRSLRRGGARVGGAREMPRQRVEEGNNRVNALLRNGLTGGTRGYARTVTIGTSLVLIAVGAILKYAVTAEVSWIDIQTCGVILMIIGILGLILSLLYTFLWSNSTRSNKTPPPGDQYDQPTRRY